MSVRSGFSPEYVVATRDGISGRTIEALKATHDRVSQDTVHPTILSALAEITVSAEANEKKGRKDLLDNGQYLFGLTALRGFDHVYEPYDALLFVEGKNESDGAYETVEIANWIDKDSDRIGEAYTDPLRFMMDKVLCDADDEKQVFNGEV